MSCLVLSSERGRRVHCMTWHLISSVVDSVDADDRGGEDNPVRFEGVQSLTQHSAAQLRRDETAYTTWHRRCAGRDSLTYLEQRQKHVQVFLVFAATTASTTTVPAVVLPRLLLGLRGWRRRKLFRSHPAPHGPTRSD